MSQFAAMLLLVFFFKLLAIGLCARLIIKKYPDILASLLGSWLVIQCFFIAWMLLLSAFHSLSAGGIWLGMFLVNFVFVLFLARETKAPTLSITDWKLFLSPTNSIAFLTMVAIFSILTYRSIYFFDQTLDGVIYGLTHLEFYAYYKTLFTVQPTQAFNLFSNEWNGELNGLFYQLAVDNDQAVSFGNVEIWLFCILGYSWLSGLFGLPARFRVVAGLLLGSTPVLLGLAMTINGDLLAIMSFAIALGFTLRVLTINNKLHNELDLLFAFTALGIASGAKITVLPYVILMAILLLWVGFRGRKDTFWLFSGCILSLATGNSRYIINLFIYGNPFKHVESAVPSVSNVINNLNGIVKTGLSLPDLSSQETAWILTYGLGFLGIPMLTWFGYGLWRKNKNLLHFLKTRLSLPFILTLFFLGLGFSLLLLTLPSSSWSFRYFCPYLMLFATFMLAYPYRHFFLKKYNAYGLAIFSVLIVAANVYFMLSKIGEGFPVPFKVAMAQSEMERKLAFHPYLWTGANGLKGLGLEKSDRTLILSKLNFPILPFFGEDHRNRIELVDNLTSLKERAATNQYQIIAVPYPDPHVSFKLNLPGYKQIASYQPFWIVFSHDK
ncbi:hypothetical protein HRQ65_02100 [Tatlockia micdadei]|uniref:hypothetical protein n=1 Tax=Legionella micdadei TaxID=451 RepID=UPI00156E99A7|nr:hypothetical protein [Legionella micdadei]NSL17175.1 hypothetical protein [Legionella micdadei]